MSSKKALKNVQSEDIQTTTMDIESYCDDITTYPNCYDSVETKRTTGKDLNHLFGEHIDNSRDSGATKCSVIVQEGKRSDLVGDIIISDNGSGMNEQKLKGAFSLGKKNLRKRYKGETGAYGIGGTLSALTHYDRKDILTRSEGGVLLARSYDMEKVKELDNWHSFATKVGKEEEQFFANHQGNNKTGTTIRVSVPRNGKSKRLSSTVANAKKIIGIKYYNDIIRGVMSIDVNGETVEAVCPVMSQELDARTEQRKISINGKKCIVTMVDLSKVDSKQTLENMQERAGIYFRRCGVLIMHKPVWFGDCGLPAALTSKRQNDSNCRIVIDFQEDLDTLFGVSNSKDEIDLDQSLADKITETIKGFATNIRSEANRGGTARSKGVREKVGKKMVRLANGSALPKSLKEGTYVESVEFMSLGSSVPLAVVNDKVLQVNSQHPYYGSFLSSSEEKTLVSSLSQFLCFVASEREVVEELEAEYQDDPIALAAARHAITRLTTEFDRKLRKADL